MNKTLVTMFEVIIVLVIIIAVTILVLNAYGNAYGKNQIETFDKCCNGSPCSDTYWNGTNCIYTMGQDTNWIPMIVSSWWLPLGTVLICAIVLMLLVYFIVPKEIKE